MLKNSFLLMLVAASLAASALIAPTKISRDVKVGDKHKSKLSVELDFSGQTINYSADALQEIKAVNEDGSLVIAETSENSMISMDGAEQPAGNDSTATSTYNKKGHLTKMEAEMIDESSFRFSNLFIFIFPDKEVDKGTTWEDTLAANTTNSTPKTIFKYTCEGFEEVKGKQTAKVSFDIKELEGSQPATSKGTMWIDIKTGFVMKSEGTMTNAPAAGMVVDAKFKTETV